MKKALSIVLSAFIISSSIVPIAAQKGRAGRASGEIKKQPAAVAKSTQFANVSAYTDGQGVWIAWEMKAEVGNIGFYVHRVGKGGTEVLPAENIIAGAATRAREVPSYGESYNFFDRNGSSESAYYVEALSLSGVKTTTHQIYPQYVASLRSVTGLSPVELASRSDLTSTPLESSILTMTKELVNEVEASRSFADPDTHRTVISQPGVRIGVKNEGLYRVTREQLDAANFDTNTDSSLWKLYVEGVEQAIIIGNNADYIEFYGKGTDTPESDIRQYYLIMGATPGLRIGSRVAHRNTSVVVAPSYLQTFVKKERNSYVNDIHNGELENYFGRGFAGQTNMTFNLSGIDFNRPTSALHLKFQGYSAGSHLVEVILNDQLLAPAPGDEGEVVFTADYTINTSLLREGANSIKFRAIGPMNDFVFFDTMSIDFSRKFVADQNRLSFYTTNYRTAKLDGFSSPNVRVFDLTYDGAPILMTNLNFQQNGSTFGADIPPARGRVFYAIEDSAVLAPQSITQNNPVLVGVPGNPTDLVIITHKNFITEAETWAAYRIGQGFTVKVVEVTELYDEYNYGTLNSGALKSFLQYAYENWQTKYVLLLGDGSVDSRNYENTGYWNMVPPKIVSNTYSETASDEALSDFNNDGLAEIPMGRIASRNAVGITTVFNKTVHWEARPTPNVDRGLLFAYDFSDEDYDFGLMSTRIRNNAPSIAATFVFRGEANANANLMAQMNAGKFIVNFAGHGTTGSWGGNPVFFNIFSVPTLADNVDGPAIYTMLTCLNGGFHFLFNDSFAEVLTKNPNRGAVAAWASTGETTGDVQEVMASRFFLKTGDGDIQRLGDLVKDAKTALSNEGTDVRLSWALIGDPMLKVR